MNRLSCVGMEVNSPVMDWRLLLKTIVLVWRGGKDSQTAPVRDCRGMDTALSVPLPGPRNFGRRQRICISMYFWAVPCALCVLGQTGFGCPVAKRHLKSECPSWAQVQRLEPMDWFTSARFHTSNHPCVAGKVGTLSSNPKSWCKKISYCRERTRGVSDVTKDFRNTWKVPRLGNVRRQRSCPCCGNCWHMGRAIF